LIRQIRYRTSETSDVAQNCETSVEKMITHIQNQVSYHGKNKLETTISKPQLLKSVRIKDCTLRGLNKTGGSLGFRPPLTSSCGGYRRGDVVIIHSIPTTSVGIHVNGCRATLLDPVTLNLLGDECWEALLHDGNFALPSEGGGRIVLPLHPMTAKSLFLGMHWGRLARAMMVSRIDSFEQPANSDLPTARYASVDQPIQPPPPSGGGGPK